MLTNIKLLCFNPSSPRTCHGIPLHPPQVQKSPQRVRSRSNGETCGERSTRDRPPHRQTLLDTNAPSHIFACGTYALGRKPMRHRSMPSLTQLTVSAVSSLILLCPKKPASTRICSFRTRTTTSSARTAAPHPSGCSSQERPRSRLFVPTTSTTIPDGCVGGGGSWGGGFFFLLASFDAMASGTGDAGRFAHTAAPHISHSTAALLFSA